MPQIESTSQTRFKLSPEEHVIGCTLTTLNLAVLQNLIADTAELILNLKFDPANPISFAQEKAFLDGQLQILKHLYDLHEASQEDHMKIVSGTEE